MPPFRDCKEICKNITHVPSIKETVSPGKSAHIIAPPPETMFKLFTLLMIAVVVTTYGCLITNCPRGGKRSGGKLMAQDGSIKACVSCGPGRRGQCFGPGICCGPFGCLMHTPETERCRKDGLFHDPEPCLAGTIPCRRNTGRCAAENLCCSQDSCTMDKTCTLEDKTRQAENLPPLDVYSLLSDYPTEK